MALGSNIRVIGEVKLGKEEQEGSLEMEKGMWHRKMKPAPGAPSHPE